MSRPGARPEATLDAMAKSGRVTAGQGTAGSSAQRAKVNRAVKAAIVRDGKLVKAPVKHRRPR